MTPESEKPKSKSTINAGSAVLVASTGGHLEQLHRMVQRDLILSTKTSWITFEHPQSASLLHGEDVSYVRYIPSRGFLPALRAFSKMFRTIRTADPDMVISTGAAIAFPAALAALILRREMVYIESVSRFDGPSLTGRVMRVFPNVKTFTQHPSWSNKHWPVGPRILGEYFSSEIEKSEIRKVFISLGTIKPYRFDRAISALRSVIPDGIEVRLQYGQTDGDYRGWIATDMLTSSEFSDNVSWADLVILHSGVGSILNVLDMGKMPLLLVRQREHNEHVDDHQAQVARALSEEALVRTADLDSPDWRIFSEPSCYKVTKRSPSCGGVDHRG